MNKQEADALTKENEALRAELSQVKLDQARLAAEMQILKHKLAQLRAGHQHFIEHVFS